MTNNIQPHKTLERKRKKSEYDRKRYNEKYKHYHEKQREYKKAKSLAKSEGLTQYLGKPCKHGHGNLRTVSGDRCVKCAALSSKKYRKNNREKISQQKSVYDRQYRRNNVDKIRERKLKYRLENPEKFKNSIRKSKLKNPERYYLHSRTSLANRRARLSSVIGSFTKNDIEKLFTQQGGICACCDKSIKQVDGGFHIDHKNPISLGGTNWPENLQLLTPSCNQKKGSKPFEVWLKTST